MKRTKSINPFDPQIPEESIGLSVSTAHADASADSAPWIRSDGSDDSENQRLGTAISPGRLSAIIFLSLAVLLLLGGRAFALQIMNGEKYRALAEGNRLRIVRTPSERGIILDRAGTPLVENLPMLSLVVTPSDLPVDSVGRREALSKIARMASSTTEAVIEAIGGPRARGLEPVAIRDHLDHDLAIRLSVEAIKVPGAAVTIQTERNVRYTDEIQSFGHLIGYVGRISKPELEKRRGEYQLNDRLGKTAIEAALEDTLRGSFGRKEVEIDALGREIAVLASQKPSDGSDVELTIDIKAQAALDLALRKQLSSRGLSRGAAIALDPRNGEVLALVSLPGFDPNAFGRGLSVDEYAAVRDDPTQPLFPRAISGMYPPGSTIKPIFAAAALAEGIITPKTTILSTGGITYASRWWFPDWKAGGHGLTDVTKAIADSVNTFFYYVCGGYEKFTGLGVSRMVAYAARFGLGLPTGIELPGEASGLLPTPDWKLQTKNEEWYIGDTYHMAIGQGDVLVTPLQMAAVTAAVANGGVLHDIHLVRALRDSKTGEVSQTAMEPAGQPVVPAQTLATVRAGMRRAVTDGSAAGLQSVPVAVAGKTGTAQWNETKSNHAWFTGFAPYDSPEIAIAVLIEEGGDGSSAAVPVARDFLTWYFSQN